MDFKNSKYIYKSLGVVLMAVGLIVIIGWLFKLIAIVQVISNAAPMQFNTALCFFLSGLSLLFYNEKKYIFISVLSFAIALIPCLTLIEYWFGLNIGIDQFFIEPFINAKTSAPGRMAPNTALCFLLFSLFLYLSQKRFNRFPFLMMILPSILGVLGLISIIGYVFNVEQAYAWGALTHMAIHTAIGFVLLAIASCLLIFSNSQLSNPLLATLLDYSIFLSTVLFFLVLWLVVRINYISTIKHETENQISIINAKLSVEIKRDVEAIIRLFARYRSNSYTNPSAFNQDVNYYFKHMGSLESLSFRNKGRIVSLTNPFSQDNEKVSSKACPISKLSFTQLNPAINEQSGYLCIQSGASSAAISLKQIVIQFFQQSHGRFMISLQHEGEVFYQQDISNKEHGIFWSQTSPLNIYGNNWSLTVTPTVEYVKETIGRIPLLIFCLGCSISLLVLFLLQYKRKLTAQEKALLSAEAVKTSILNSTLEGVIGVNHTFKVYFMNKSAQKLLDVKFNHEKDISLNKLIRISNHDDNIITNIKKSLVAGNSVKEEAEITLINKEKIIPVSYSTSPIIEGNDISGAIIVFSDNTQRKIYEEKLKTLALYDTLTKIPNRFSIMAHLEEVIARAQRHHITFSACFIDINKFKAINDNYGHHVGDKALQHVAKVITSVIRKNDFFGRLAGDEFCLILDGIHLENDIQRVYDKIYKALETPLIFENGSFQISLSIGSISYTNESTPEELLIKADKVMYAMKKNNT
ncbi:MAG: diguanylate cyclase [Proteobacteria bacterium]|nr:diguanylate cyclase [Pseudomonadota bacterium]